MNTYLLTTKCPDARGIIHAISSGLLAVDANVLEQEQYSDPETNLFFARTRFESPEEDLERVREAVTKSLSAFDPIVTLRNEATRRRVLLMVSQYDHCLVDILYRWQAGELPIEIVGVVSNHEVCRSIAQQHGLPFHHVPVTSDTKASAESQLLQIVRSDAVDLVVLARYMQILSDEICSALSGRIINIHHSFLPGFKGAKPYHQAHERGVKLIGATAHFVTADLDEGPIIEQLVERVSHVDSAEKLAEIGRDVERRTLSRVVRLYAEDRIFQNNQRTVVFG